MCKICDQEDGIPKFLCVACNPRKAAPPIIEEPAAPSPYAATFKKRQLRKLRREEKRLRTLADEIGRRDPAALRRVYDALQVVERDIDRVGV